MEGKEILVSDATADPGLPRANGVHGHLNSSLAAPAKETEAASNHELTIFVISKPCFTLQAPDKLVNHGKLEDMFKKGGGGWDKFYRIYPNAAGFWDFYTPATTTPRTEAVLYVGHYCGGLCGTGHLFVAKENGQWKVKNRLMLWIS